MTLLEILIIVAIVGILIVAGITGLQHLGRNQAYQGYVAGFSQAVSDATTRANETNTVYAVEFSSSGYSWGSLGGTLSACETAASAPTLTATVDQHTAPSGVAIASNGWFCFSAPGLVSRLDKLGTCSYKSYTFPCLNFTGPGRSEKMFISVGGQVLVQ